MTGRDRLVGIVILAAVLLGGFWFFILAPKRKEATALSAKVVVQEQRLVAARAAVTQAKDAQERYNGDYAAVAALGQAVPADDDVPSLIVQVNRAADREKVDFRSLTADTAGAVAAAPAAAAPAPATPAPSNGGDSGSSGGSADAQPATPAPASATGAAALPPGASVGAAGFPTMPFSFEFVGSFFRLEDFLHRVAQFTSVGSDGNLVVRGRLLSVDSIELKAASSGFPKVAASVKATAYLLPPGEGLTAGATPEGPAAADAAATGGGAPSSDGGGSPAPAPTAAATLMTGGRR